MVIEPSHPLERCELHGLDLAPGVPSPNDLAVRLEVDGVWEGPGPDVDLHGDLGARESQTVLKPGTDTRKLDP